MAPSGAAARPIKTIVSTQFDDGVRQSAARTILKKHHMHGTFFINSGYVGTGDGYFTWKQIRRLAADGNEIAGHTLTHRDLVTLSPAEQAREICIDRRQLIQHGLRPVDFGYPFGSYDATTERIVRGCGYQSGRAAWGLWGSGCEQTPRDCPYSVDPTEHRLCNDDCDEYSWDPALLDQFLTWLQKRRADGTVVMTSQQVLNERWRGSAAELAAIHAPSPPPPPAGPNGLRNPGLERFDAAASAPACWELTGSGSWSRVQHAPGHAEQAVISGAPDGYAAIAQPLSTRASVHQGWCQDNGSGSAPATDRSTLHASLSGLETSRVPGRTGPRAPGLDRRPASDVRAGICRPCHAA